MGRSRLSQPLQWYQWNPSQWQGSRKVQRMDWAARGLYRELMDECWIKGFVPSSVSGIATIFEVDESEIAPLLPQIIRCFDVHDDGTMTSPFIEEIRTEADARRIIQANRRLGKDKNGNPRLTEPNQSEPRLTTVSKSEPLLTEPNQSEVVQESREEKSKDEKKEPDKLAPVARGDRKAKGIVLGDYSPEFEEADSTWRRLFKETRAFVDFIPPDKVHVASAPGSKAAGWGAWKRLLTFRVNGSGFVQPSDLLEAVKAHAAAKIKRAREGTELNLPMFSTLLNKPEMLDAVVHIVKQRHDHLEIPA